MINPEFWKHIGRNIKYLTVEYIPIEKTRDRKLLIEPPDEVLYHYIITQSGDMIQHKDFDEYSENEYKRTSISIGIEGELNSCQEFTLEMMFSFFNKLNLQNGLKEIEIKWLNQ